MSYYAVRVGVKSGIYSTWAECEANVKGYSGAIYKKFSTSPEALKFIKGETVSSTTPTRNVPLIISPPKFKTIHNDNYVYTDGGFRKGRASWAFVKGEIERFGEVFADKVSNNIAELTAIIKALEYFKGDITIATDSEYSMNVITGAKKSHCNLELIAKARSLMESRNVKFVYVEAHCGISGNERCDTLCTRVLTE